MQSISGYSSQKNGAAERLNRTLWKSTVTMLVDSGLPKRLWAEALVHAAHIHKVTNATGGPTPWERMKGEEPDLSTPKAFGAPFMVKVPDQTRRKLEPRAQPGRLLGFDIPSTKAYHFSKCYGYGQRSCT
jgi:hypothetical protein